MLPVQNISDTVTDIPQWFKTQVPTIMCLKNFLMFGREKQTRIIGQAKKFMSFIITLVLNLAFLPLAS